MKFFLFVSCLCWTTLAVGQGSIKGRVLGPDQQPASFAAVVVQKAADSSAVKGGLTAEDGSFVLANVPSGGPYVVSIQYVGSAQYRSDTLRLDSASTASVELGTIKLQQVAKSLQEVTVKTQKTLIERQADRIVLSVENSVITKGNTVNELLKYAPLVRVDNSGSISVGNKSSVLVLVDGRQMGQGALSGFLQTFSAEDVLKVEVITNPSARYDAGFGAVINIVTRKSLENGFNGRATMAYSQGQYGRLNPNGSLNFRQGKWSVFGSLNAFKPAWYYTSMQFDRFFPDGSLRNSMTTLNEYGSLATNLGVDYAINDQHVVGIRLNGKLTDDANDNRTNTAFVNTMGQSDSTLYTTNESMEHNRVYDANLNYKGTFKAGRELTVNLTQTRLRKDVVQDIAYQLSIPSGGIVRTPDQLRIVNPSQQYSFIGQTDYTTPIANGKAKVDVGAKFIDIRNDNVVRQERVEGGQYTTDPSYTFTGLYTERTYAAYTTVSKQFKSGLSIQGGVRAEQTRQELRESSLERTYGGLFPSLSISRSFDNGRAWGVTLSRKISRPSLNSLVPYRYVVDRYTLIEGNPYILPTFSNTLDSYYNLGSVTVFANYTYNRNLITNVISGDVQTRIYTQKDDNLRNVHDFYGGVTLSKNITRKWQTNTTLVGTGNYTDTPLNELASFRTSGFWTYINSTNIISLPKSWKYELSLIYSSPMRYAIFRQKSIYGMSMSINKAILAEKGSLRVSFEDIFRTQRSRIESSYGVVNMAMRSYSDQQRVRFTFSYNFGKKTVKSARETSLGNDSEKGRMSNK
ncbi:outer membrane beta-barrel protein [Spirosoma linguale]|uniref:TonB-dependent receptor plug n=1 Tax=Spirosoma linguale (strain ATCC 33905 / DSM 74 / LMG 10896 / Claus 1) TaxID=504472 RepID=D2QPL8_SPILD|nr:TonB-dependent receptor plug [Spirosoma linguale DSM 74]